MSNGKEAGVHLPGVGRKGDHWITKISNGEWSTQNTIPVGGLPLEPSVGYWNNQGISKLSAGGSRRELESRLEAVASIHQISRPQKFTTTFGTLSGLELEDGQLHLRWERNQRQSPNSPFPLRPSSSSTLEGHLRPLPSALTSGPAVDTCYEHKQTRETGLENHGDLAKAWREDSFRLGRQGHASPQGPPGSGSMKPPWQARDPHDGRKGSYGLKREERVISGIQPRSMLVATAEGKSQVLAEELLLHPAKLARRSKETGQVAGSRDGHAPSSCRGNQQPYSGLAGFPACNVRKGQVSAGEMESQLSTPTKFSGSVAGDGRRRDESGEGGECPGVSRSGEGLPANETCVLALGTSTTWQTCASPLEAASELAALNSFGDPAAGASEGDRDQPGMLSPDSEAMGNRKGGSSGLRMHSLSDSCVALLSSPPSGLQAPGGGLQRLTSDCYRSPPAGPSAPLLSLGRSSSTSDAEDRVPPSEVSIGEPSRICQLAADDGPASLGREGPESDCQLPKPSSMDCEIKEGDLQEDTAPAKRGRGDLPLLREEKAGAQGPWAIEIPKGEEEADNGDGFEESKRRPKGGPDFLVQLSCASQPAEGHAQRPHQQVIAFGQAEASLQTTADRNGSGGLNWTAGAESARELKAKATDGGQGKGKVARVHECRNCNMCFPSAQALGGHQNAHRSSPRGIPQLQAAVVAAAHLLPNLPLGAPAGCAFGAPLAQTLPPKCTDTIAAARSLHPFPKVSLDDIQLRSGDGASQSDQLDCTGAPVKGFLEYDRRAVELWHSPCKLAQLSGAQYRAREMDRRALAGRRERATNAARWQPAQFIGAPARLQSQAVHSWGRESERMLGVNPGLSTSRHDSCHMPMPRLFGGSDLADADWQTFPHPGTTRQGLNGSRFPLVPPGGNASPCVWPLAAAGDSEVGLGGAVGEAGFAGRPTVLSPLLAERDANQCSSGRWQAVKRQLHARQEEEQSLDLCLHL